MNGFIDEVASQHMHWMDENGIGGCDKSSTPQFFTPKKTSSAASVTCPDCRWRYITTTLDELLRAVRWVASK